MSWGEIKRRIERMGVKDADVVWFVDISMARSGEEWVVERDEQLGTGVSDLPEVE